MTTWSWLGCPKAELDTPALLIDLAAFEANLETLRALTARAGIAYRPHAKAHKSPLLARKQLQAGAIGVCCAKLGEAEVMVAAGIPGILVTAEVVGPAKLRRLVATARHGDVMVVADHPAAVAELAAAAQAAGVELGVLVEVDVGQGRCGTPPGAPALALARQIADAKGLVFRGVQGYHGAIQGIVEYPRREAEARAAVGRLLETAELIRKDGLPAEIITAGGTGTLPFDAAARGLTEVQPGSYIFMDATYSRIQWNAAGDQPPFRPSLTILGTVISRPARDRAVVDVGWKAASSDSGSPVPIGVPGARFDFGGDEYGVLRFDGTCPLELGARVEFSPSHCDTTVNLHDQYFALRDGVVEAVWPIPGRGKSQ